MRKFLDPVVAEAAANELLRQHAQRLQFTGLTGAGAPTTAGAAYQIQDVFVAQSLRQRQTTLCGYKIALTTVAMREMVGFHDSVSGRLFNDQMLRSGHTLQARDYVHLIVEFEIAFELARDLPVRATPWTGASILECVACAYPALEIADDRAADYANLNESVLTLVADNAWNQGLVLGPAVTKFDVASLLALAGIAFIDDREVGRGTGRDVMGHPLEALAWLANHLQGRDMVMKAGDIVTTGSLVRSQFPVAGTRIAFRLANFGEVTLNVD